jgi:predicted outer membrane repeat protein
MINLTSITFSNNSANSGGAIYLEDTFTYCYIRFCKFLSNVADGQNGLGGALFVGSTANSDAITRRILTSVNTLLVVNSSFLWNGAAYGGAIYSQEQGLSILNSTFSYNNALSGGAFAALFTDPSKAISINNSVIAHNTAQTYDGAFLSFRGIPYVIDSKSAVYNNTQQYLDGIPAEMRLIVYASQIETTKIDKQNIAGLIAEGQLV